MLVAGLNITGRTVAQKSSLSAIEGILCQAGVDLCLNQRLHTVHDEAKGLLVAGSGGGDGQ